MTAVSMARAHLAVVMCFVNISLAMAFWKLSLEMKTHGQLQKSHAALQKQAAGISQEYSRITATSAPSKASVAADPHDRAEIIAAKVPVAKASSACTGHPPLPVSHCSTAFCILCCSSSLCLSMALLPLTVFTQARMGL